MPVCGSGGLVCSSYLLIRRAQRARCQAETPPILLSRFPEPALRSLLRMKAFPRTREIEKLKNKMFPLRTQKEGVTTRRPHLDRIMDKSYGFKGHDVTKVFEHARMLDFSTPINLLLNPEYRGLTDKLASL